MDISVCIVNWNTKELLYECINSIKCKTSKLQYEIIVVDNNSNDGSAEMLKKEFPDDKLIESNKNLGFVKGNNLAVKEATGKYILYLNPDTRLLTNAIYGMNKLLETNNEYSAVGCKILNPDGTIQFTCARTFPTPLNQFCYLAMLNRLFPKSKLMSTIEMGYWDHTTSREVDCLSGACMMVRKNTVDQLMGFDEALFMYGEDVDLCYRIKGKEGRIYYLANEKIIHFEGAGTQKKSNKNFSSVMQRESNYYFFKKHFGYIKAWQFRFAISIGSLIRIFETILLIPFLKSRLADEEKSISEIIYKYLNIFFWSIGLKKSSS